MTLPDPEAIRAVQRRLRAEQGPFEPGAGLPVIDQIVATVLSQHTSDVNSARAFAQLKATFPTWEQTLEAPAEQVATAIRSGGIANLKARRVQQVLAVIRHREGCLDLSRLDGLPDQEVEEYLLSLPGVGPKTAACTLTFSMGRSAFPIDTHVHRIVTRLGWLPWGISADKAHRLLGPLVPPDIRYDLHVALIAHGRNICRARWPRCEECAVRDLCAYGSATARASEAG